MSCRILLVLVLSLLAACGGEDDTVLPVGGKTPTMPMGPSDDPACLACYDTLVAETNLCGPALDSCINQPNQTTPGFIACFRTEASCFDTSLQKSAGCNRDCGDDNQANLELCTAQCFLGRGECSEVVIRAVDACLTQCETQSQCDTCTAEGRLAFDSCNLNLTNCGDACIRMYRGG